MFRGDRLAALRVDADLLQKQVAAEIHVDADTVSAYETGSSPPSMKVLYRIADFFDVSIDYLCGRTDNPKSHKTDNKLIRLPENAPQEMCEDMHKHLTILTKYYNC